MELLQRIERSGWAGVPIRLQHVLLLVAILPSLTFLGHWSIEFNLPGGASSLLIVPATAGHDDAHAGHDHGQAHTNHCHADASSCTDQPFTGASAFALLQETIAYLGAPALLTALAVAWWRPSGPLRSCPISCLPEPRSKPDPVPRPCRLRPPAESVGYRGHEIRKGRELT